MGLCDDAFLRLLVDETPNERRMKRVAEFVFDGARALLPMFRVFDTQWRACDIRPRANRREARDEHVDVALGVVKQSDLRRGRAVPGPCPCRRPC